MVVASSTSEPARVRDKNLGRSFPIKGTVRNGDDGTVLRRWKLDRTNLVLTVNVWTQFDFWHRILPDYAVSTFDSPSAPEKKLIGYGPFPLCTTLGDTLFVHAWSRIAAAQHGAFVVLSVLLLFP